MNAATAAGVGFALSAAFIYFLLRFFVSNATHGNRARNISSHAFWTAVIALFASGVSGLDGLWSIPDTPVPGDPGTASRIITAASPGLWLGLIYVLGQFTWPRHLQPVRSASLQVRSVAGLIPKLMAGLLVLAALLAGVAIAVAWNDPGAAQLSADMSGTLPGHRVAPYLAGGLGTVLASTLAVIVLVVKRPPLQTLSTEENDTLRRIWINRLLRTAVIVVSGFGAMALNYLAESASGRAARFGPGAVVDATHYIETDAAVSWLLGGGAVWMIAAIVAMAAWAPPRLPKVLSDTPRTADRNSAGFAKARGILLFAQVLAVALVGVAALAAGLGSPEAGTATWETTMVDGQAVETLVHLPPPSRLEGIEAMALALALAAGYYLLLQLLASHLIKRRLGDSVELDVPRRNLLPRWFTTLIGAAVAFGLASIAMFALGSPDEFSIAVAWMLGILGGTALLAVLLHRHAARRPAVAGASAAEDLQLRVVLAHRGARVLGGVSLVVSGIVYSPWWWVPARYADYMPEEAGAAPSGAQVLCLVLGVALCLLPAATAYPSPKPATPTPATSTP
ncbi:hypothetical protein GCM10009715_17130 [Paeniglutamicibacter psychrophenolicus]|uniref:Uncharacterized protein n=1 Tax=Paeniglutamicibacter psychrophenolicus TaxID=257454 RepID=A0ABS4WCM8_9MICC|nr:hypothetical protein [Paeniglutamicibacter psychrophenolicus]MBP2373957.1 hypothetical protein [Paeniglutamicibacter psychrophenolicus]